MDTLSIALCISIGSCVAWLVALYTPAGTPSLLWNVPLGMAGAALCALAIAWLAPRLGVFGLVIVGPFGALAHDQGRRRDPSRPAAPCSSGSVVKNGGSPSSCFRTLFPAANVRANSGLIGGVK